MPKLLATAGFNKTRFCRLNWAQLYNSNAVTISSQIRRYARLTARFTPQTYKTRAS